jgi:glycerophosphoryl diester phosphodiesterase
VAAPISPGVLPPHPLIYAHRGGCALAPENTIAAFDRGMEAGADGFELDVRVSRDGIPIVHHDPDLGRCTDGRGPIAALTAAELASIDAGHYFDPENGYPWRGRGIAIPTLEAVLRRFPNASIIAEVKTYTGDAARAVARSVIDAAAVDRVCIGGFDIATMRAVRAFAPELVTGAAQTEVRGALYRSWAGLRPWRPRYRAMHVPEAVGRTRIVTPRFIARLHAAGIPVQVWTVNEEPNMVRLLDWGVDGLISDRPDLAVVVRDRWMRTRAGIHS